MYYQSGFYFHPSGNKSSAGDSGKKKATLQTCFRDISTLIPLRPGWGSLLFPEPRRLKFRGIGMRPSIQNSTIRAEKGGGEERTLI
jgi:hypothetical protein